jgi:hypothetical protein
MKKIILLIAAFSLLAAGQSFAGTAATALNITATGLSAYGGPNTGSTPTLIGKTSTGVGLGWNVGAGGYALATQHKSGSRAFGTSWDSTSIYYTEATPGVVPTIAASAPGASDSSAFQAAGWQSM